MRTPNIEVMSENMLLRDVGKPHAANLIKQICLSTSGQAIVSKGRTQAADTLHWWRGAEQSATRTPQKTRSRGCRPAPEQFLRYAPLPSWPHALQKSLKQFTLKKLFHKSRFIPVSTSNIWGRVLGASRAVPALFLSAPSRAGGAA